MPQENAKAELFERTPIPRAVLTMAVPTVLSSLVMVIYNLADTYFVGYLNDPIQNAAYGDSGCGFNHHRCHPQLSFLYNHLRGNPGYFKRCSGELRQSGWYPPLQNYNYPFV